MLATSLPHLPTSSEFYYLEHFESALDWLADQRGHLLSVSDLQFIAGYRNLSQNARALWTRLLLRRRVHFRTRHLSYPEIEIPTALTELCAQRWLITDSPLSAGEIAQLCLKTELQALLQVTTKSTKGELIARLPLQHQTALQWDLNFEVFTLQHRACADRLRLIFFGNLHQDWHQFVLHDLGHQRFMPIQSRKLGGFEDVNDVNIYLECSDIEREVETGGTLFVCIQRVLGLTPQGYTARQKRDRVGFNIIRQIERDGAFNEAAEAYRRCGHPEAWVRRIRCLERAGQASAALVAVNAPPANAQPAQLEQADRIRRRLLKQKAPADPIRIPVQHCELDQTRHVEQSAADFLGPRTLWVENSMMNTLFVLTLWDAIWADVTGAFFNPFQSAPSDLYSPDFADRRADWIDKAMGQISEVGFVTRLIERAEFHHGISCHLVNWNLAQPSLITKFFEGISPTQWRGICRYFLANLKDHRSGQPDLIKFTTPLEFIEVKGPGDRLQPHQSRWIRTLLGLGLDARVLEVSWK